MGQDGGKVSNPFDVVNYEIEMFLGAQILQKTKIHSATQDKILEGFLRNAITESQVLHIRVLTEVFLSQGRKDDIKIDNLIPNWSLDNIEAFKQLEAAYIERLETGESPKVYIDKLLAHATTKRADSFNWAPVVRRMNPPIINVLKCLSMDQFPGLMFLKYIEQ
jgi:hypothetical protein